MARKFLVSKAVEDRHMTGVEVDGRNYEFGKNTGYSFTVSDPGVADVISKELGTEGGSRKVVVSEIPSAKREGIHRYHFTVRKCNAPGCFASPVAKGYCEEHYGIYVR